VLNFEALGLAKMAAADYVVLVQTEGGTPTVDESTKTTEGFSVIDGVADDVLNVLVIGRLAGQSA